VKKIEFRAVAVVTLVVGVPEEDVIGNQDGAVCNRAYGGPDEDVVGKQDCSVTKGSRWPQDFQPGGLVYGGAPPVT